jgi:hypothetical protein
MDSLHTNKRYLEILELAAGRRRRKLMQMIVVTIATQLPSP